MRGGGGFGWCFFAEAVKSHHHCLHHDDGDDDEDADDLPLSFPLLLSFPYPFSFRRSYTERDWSDEGMTPDGGFAAILILGRALAIGTLTLSVPCDSAFSSLHSLT